jgi:hypothetical protein
MRSSAVKMPASINRKIGVRFLSHSIATAGAHFGCRERSLVRTSCVESAKHELEALHSAAMLAARAGVF